MAVPKQRKSSSRRDMRRANHDKVAAPNLVPCTNCSAPMVPHRVCPSCGWYAGRAVLVAAQAEGGEATTATEPTAV